MDNDGTSEEDTVKAKGFCTCKRDFPQRRSFHPPVNATWHYLCDKPVLGPALGLRETGTGWPDDTGTAWVEENRRIAAGYADPLEYEPDDAEAQRIAEVFADARAEQDRGL